MRRICVVGLVLVLFLASSSRAFDGHRRGFVLGGGLGLAPTARFALDGGSFGSLGFEDEGIGFGLQFIIGGAFDENNVLVYEGNVVAWTAEYTPLGLLTISESVAQGFNGAAFYHYFGPVGRSAFIAGGIGFYVFRAEDWENDPGFGMMFGGGYEFSKHWQVGGYLSFGKTSDIGLDFDHHHVNILVSGIAF